MTTYSTISIDLGLYIDKTYLCMRFFFGIKKVLIDVVLAQLVLASNPNSRSSIVVACPLMDLDRKSKG